MDKEGLEISTIDWTEVQKVVLDIKTDRKDGWHHLVPSPDKRYEARYNYQGEIPWGPAYFTVQVYERQNHKLIWEGGPKRNFGMPPPKDYLSPWGANSEQLGLIEWNSFKGNIQSPILISVNDGTENEIKIPNSYTLHFLPSSFNGLICNVWGKRNQTVYFLNENREPLTLGFSELHRNLLSADSSIPNVVLICNQLKTPLLQLYNVKKEKIIKEWKLHPQIFDSLGHLQAIPNKQDVFSGEIDLGSIKIGATSKLSVGDAEGNVWDDLIWDRHQDRYFLGIMRASSWGQNDYYKGQEWLEIKIKNTGTNKG
ncbi:MAG: hypothetical protein K9J37_20610 [Saprospiraceae bacterium]|nr:hypothetical protein [Saprospiraceae bacterium]MCF8252323.1 hypothetical protein [Saprospiraceae bacterium]MCF8282146.1 hypothetical protein [Bacteroidales bacterium]MCF8313966.1 hypothetical protein [Saprospiraceae bacterium]MCF8442675.1 hypothetical protein [Saprospiraceae bacterium]